MSAVLDRAVATRRGRLIRLPGLTPYTRGHDLMRDLASRRLRGEDPDTLILLEHEPVFTAVSAMQPDHLRWTDRAIRAAGAPLVAADRGGSVTFHGPGQLVAYPVLHLGDRAGVVAYLRAHGDFPKLA